MYHYLNRDWADFLKKSKKVNWPGWWIGQMNEHKSHNECKRGSHAWSKIVYRGIYIKLNQVNTVTNPLFIYYYALHIGFEKSTHLRRSEDSCVCKLYFISFLLSILSDDTKQNRESRIILRKEISKGWIRLKCA